MSHRSSSPQHLDDQVSDRGSLFLRYFKLKRRRGILPRSNPEIVTTISARDIDLHHRSKRSPDSSDSRGSMLSRGGTSSLSSSTRSSKGQARPSLDSSDAKHVSSTAFTPQSPSFQGSSDALEELASADETVSRRKPFVKNLLTQGRIWIRSTTCSIMYWM